MHLAIFTKAAAENGSHVRSASHRPEAGLLRPRFSRTMPTLTHASSAAPLARHLTTKNYTAPPKLLDFSLLLAIYNVLLFIIEYSDTRIRPLEGYRCERPRQLAVNERVEVRGAPLGLPVVVFPSGPSREQRPRRVEGGAERQR